MGQPVQFVFPGTVTINFGPTADEIRAIITDALEAAMTEPLANIDDALTALQTKADAAAAAAQAEADARAADRAAFDTLAADMRAFIASVTAGGALSADQQTHAQSILDSLDATAAADTASATADTTQATDEGTLQGEVPAA